MGSRDTSKKTSLFAAVFAFLCAAAAVWLLYCERLQMLPPRSKSFLAGIPICFFSVFFLAFFLIRFIFRKTNALSRNNIFAMVLICLVGTACTLVWFPYPDTGLLTEHTLRIRGNDAAPILLTWLKTEYGDARFSDFEGSGSWVLTDEGILLNDASAEITWTGKTGRSVTLEFAAGEDRGPAFFEWDGRKTEISLFNREADRLSYDTAFPPNDGMGEFLAEFWLTFVCLCAGYLYLFYEEKKLSPEVFFGLSFVLFAVFRIRQTIPVEPLWFVDSQSYIGVSELSWKEIFTGTEYCYPQYWYCLSRPMTIPLVYKLCGQDRDRIVLVQAIFSILSWGYFAWEGMRAVRRKRLSKLLTAVLFLFASFPNVTRWDGMIMSESIALSLGALLLGTGLRFCRNWDALSATAFILVTTLFSQTRDSAPWTSLLCALVLGGIGFVRAHRKPAWLTAAFVGAISLFLMANNGARWQFPYENVLFHRIMRDEQAAAFFIESGMPQPKGFETLIGEEHFQGNALFNSEEFAPLREWILSDGMKVHFRYLLRDPLKTLGMAWNGFEQEAFEQISYRYAPTGWREGLPSALSKFISLNIPGMAMILLGVYGIYAAFHQKRGEELAIPIVILLSAYFMALGADIADTYDFERHVVVQLMMMKAAAWILLFQLIDRGNDQ